MRQRGIIPEWLMSGPRTISTPNKDWRVTEKRHFLFKLVKCHSRSLTVIFEISYKNISRGIIMNRYMVSYENRSPEEVLQAGRYTFMRFFFKHTVDIIFYVMCLIPPVQADEDSHEIRSHLCSHITQCENVLTLNSQRHANNCTTNNCIKTSTKTTASSVPDLACIN